MSAGRGLLFLAAVACANVLILWLFHDRFWYPVDEGNYAHVAERILAGEILNRDIQDIHPGYINFLNAAAFKVFGMNLVSLRYPLMLAALAQSCLVALLLASRGTVAAVVGSLATTALGVIQFLNPTAHWYCLMLVVVLVGWLWWMPVRHSVRIVGAGALVGTIFLFRQLSGIWVAMAALVLLLEERSSDAKGSQTLVARSVVAVMLAMVVVYLTSIAVVKLSGFVAIALWPVALLGLTLWRTQVGNRDASAVLAQLALGAIISAVPLVWYHLAHGSVVSWLNDTVRAAGTLPRLTFFGGTDWLGLLSLLGLHGMVGGATIATAVNGFYWMMLPAVPLLAGSMTVLRARRGSMGSLCLPVVATFYALVTLHLEGPIYLYYTLGLSVAALLWMATTAATWFRVGSVTTIAVLSVVGVVYHASHSTSRTVAQMVSGEGPRISDTMLCQPFERSALRVDVRDCERYHRLVDVIEKEVPPGRPMFAVPSDAELYFLANRPNPFRFFNTALGVLDTHDLTQVLTTLVDDPPVIVTFRPDDKYNTAASQRIAEHVRGAYDLLETIDGVEVYRLRASGIEEERP